MGSPSGIRLALAFLQENERLVRRYFEPCATRLAVHHVVDANHVVTKLGIERAIAFVGARRNPIFLDATDPALHVIGGGDTDPRVGRTFGSTFRAV